MEYINVKIIRPTHALMTSQRSKGVLCLKCHAAASKPPLNGRLLVCRSLSLNSATWYFVILYPSDGCAFLFIFAAIL